MAYRFVKCLFAACIFYIFEYPGGVRLGTHAISQRQLQALAIVQDQNHHAKELAAKEPGFDFTDEEMQTFKLWKRGIIPYFLDPSSFDKVLRDRVRGFLEAVNIVTGLRFVGLTSPPIDDSSRWIFFINRRAIRACSDMTVLNFTITGVQRVILGYDCMMSVGSLAEIVLALAGVPSQHNAPNRDKYVSVVESNLLPNKIYLYKQLQDNEWLFHDIDYDFSSAGHYDFHRYTANGQMTLRPVIDVNIPVGESTGFSYSDIWKIRMLYNYISKKDETLDKSECCNLYEPGKNFTNYKTEENDNVEPRKKPNKYLGLPEENDETETASEQEEESTSETDNDCSGSGCWKDETDLYLTPSKTHKKPHKKPRKKNNKKEGFRKKKFQSPYIESNKKKLLLLDYSDYHSEM